VRAFGATFLVPTQSVTAIKLSVVGAGRAHDDGATTLQLLCKYRGHGPLLRSVDVLVPTLCVGTHTALKTGNHLLNAMKNVLSLQSMCGRLGIGPHSHAERGNDAIGAAGRVDKQRASTNDATNAI
jgi:hypothetical protein